MLYKEERGQIFLAQAAKVVSLALPAFRTSTTARLSQNIFTFFYFSNGQPRFYRLQGYLKFLSELLCSHKSLLVLEAHES